MKGCLVFVFGLVLCTRLLAIKLEVTPYNFYGSVPFTEVYFRVDGSSLEWKTIEDQKMATVEIIYVLSDMNGQIVKYDKFSLTNTHKDSIQDFIAIKRLSIPDGSFKLKVEATDMTQVLNKIELEQQLTVDKNTATWMISDLQLLARLEKSTENNVLVKNGLFIEPLAFNYCSKDKLQLDIYTEIYGQSNQNQEDHFVQYSIVEGFKSNINSKPIMTKYKKLNNQAVEVLVLSFSLNTLRSGDYHVQVSVIDKAKNVLVTRQENFVKSNPDADLAYLESYNLDVENSFVQKLKAEDMDYILKAHVPITDQNQISTLGQLLKSNRIKSQRQFIFQFWKSKSPANPELSYTKYMEVADAVNKKFYTNVGYGFQSDRGHIFLKYGKPSNVLSIDTENDAPPYEIWYYNNIPQNQQTNVRFLFYNPSLAHNDYQLLHSTCLGERINPAWEVQLYKSVPLERIGNTIDATQVQDNVNRNARRYFNEF